MLHEYCWRGREKRFENAKTVKVRSKMLMDQKANSIADLAAVLEIQDRAAELQQARTEKFLKRQEEDGERRDAKMARLSRIGSPQYLEKLDKDLEKMLTRIREADKASKPRWKTMMNGLKKHRALVVKAMEDAKIPPHATTETASKEKPVIATTEDKMAPSKQDIDANLEARESAPAGTSEEASEESFGEEHRQFIEDVVISWANLNDANLAKAWPEKVLHDELYPIEPVDGVEEVTAENTLAGTEIAGTPIEQPAPGMLTTVSSTVKGWFGRR
jgi:hypothetical protein